MEPDSGVSSRQADKLTQHEVNFHEDEAKLSNASEWGDGNRPDTVHAHYHHPKDTDEVDKLSNEDPAELKNDEVICVIAKDSQIRVLSIGSAVDNERPQVKLYAINATNLPQEFIKDNIISPQFPYLEHESKPLAAERTPRFYVVISTHSGSSQAEAFYRNNIQPLLASGSAPERNHTTIVTTSPSSVTEFAQQTLFKHANAGLPQTVLLLSGDGGIVDIVNALLSEIPKTPLYRSPTMGIVAMGTGNALAYSTGLSRDRTLGLRRFYQGTPHPLPTFTATFSPGSAFLVNEGSAKSPLPTNAEGLGVVHGAVVCSWALHASIVADSDTTEYRRCGNARFSLAAQRLLRPVDGSSTHEYKGRVSYSPAGSSGVHHAIVESGSLHSYVLATLVSHLEPGFHISPASKPLDGQLRLLRIGAPIAAEAMEAVLGKAFADGSHVDDPAVEYESVDSVRMEIREAEERWRRVCVDGKIVVVPEGGWVEIKKHGIEDSVVNIVA